MFPISQLSGDCSFNYLFENMLVAYFLMLAVKGSWFFKSFAKSSPKIRDLCASWNSVVRTRIFL